MRRVYVVPAMLGILLCQTISAADRTKRIDPVSVKANKARLFAASKPQPIHDPTNQPPPSGAILDLNGTPIPGHGNGTTFQQYTVNFVAALANTAITFAFREDPAFESFEEASVKEQTVPGPNLLVNGDFSGGTYTSSGNSSAPVGWTYANVYGASAGGVVRTGCGGPQPSGYCWYDGAVQAYDAISQTIATTVGHTYQISYYLADNGGGATFSRVSTNGDVSDTGGNGIDVLAYALAGLPAPGGGGSPPTVPALSTAGLFLMALLLAATALVLVRRGLLAP